MKQEGHWYIAKIRPGAGRAAKDRIDLPHERRDETIVERSLRDEGFDCYFPRMRKEIVHHRTNKIIVRRFPLFAGYIFVNGLSRNGVSVLDCDGVSYVLGNDGRPFPVPSMIVERFRSAEGDLQFDDTTEAKIHRGEIEKSKRGQLQVQFGKGRRVNVVGGPFSSFAAKVEGITSRDTIKAVVEIFGRLTPVEFDASDLEVVDGRREAA